MSTNLPDLRGKSPDWKEAQSVATGLLLGQQTLKVEDAQQRLSRMQPAFKERLVGLIQRWHDLTLDANQLVDDIDIDLRRCTK